jgi:hypothetical protein
MIHGSEIKRYRRRSILPVGLVAITTLSSPCLHSQTTSTGALAGATLDPSGAELPGVVLSLTQRETGHTESEISDEHGRFSFLLLSPGTYQLQASRTDFDSLNLTELHIALTETLRLELRLQLAAHFERAMVSSKPLMVQTDSAALGRVVNESSVSELPLVTRNFAQITGLSPWRSCRGVQRRRAWARRDGAVPDCQIQ